MSDEQHVSGDDPRAMGESSGGYRVQLPTFEGPLDLLLHLIEQHDLNVLDIPIGFVAQKYFEYISLMEELNIDLASEYLVMAATLVHIKSKLLLPAVPGDQDEALADEEADPRAELIRRLLEYQKYRDAAQRLGERSVLGRDVFTRGAPAPAVEGPAPLERLGLFQLLDAFQRVLGRAQKKIEHEVELDRLSITERINQLYDLLRDRRKLEFEELFEGQRTRTELIVTFLALLEMTRLNMTRLYQDDTLSPIVVELTETAVRPEPEPDLTEGAFGEEPVTALDPDSQEGGFQPDTDPTAGAFEPEADDEDATEGAFEAEADSTAGASEPDTDPTAGAAEAETEAADDEDATEGALEPEAALDTAPAGADFSPDGEPDTDSDAVAFEPEAAVEPAAEGAMPATSTEHDGDDQAHSSYPQDPDPETTEPE